jgi:hypothetical protein
VAERLKISLEILEIAPVTLEYVQREEEHSNDVSVLSHISDAGQSRLIEIRGGSR